MSRQYFFTGAGAPTSTPTYEGSVYVDTTNDRIYFATGTSSSSDWDLMPVNLSEITIDGDLALAGVRKIKNALGLDFQASTELTISSGAITQTQTLHSVDTELDASTDDLDTITAATDINFLALKLENSARVVTLKHNTGNLHLPGGADVAMKFDLIYIFIYDGTNWILSQDPSTSSKTGAYRTISFNAGGMTPRTTNGAASGTKEFTTNDIDLDFFDFDAATDEGVQVAFMMPDEWDLSTVKFKFVWTTAATAGTGDVVWGVRAVAVGNDDALDATFGTAQTVTDSFLLADDNHTTAATPAVTIGGTPALGDLVIFEFYRDADNGSDTYTQDARLLNVTMQYKESATEPSAW